MPTLRRPLGRLGSWGAFSFISGRSKRLTGNRITTQAQHAVLAGGLLSVDRYADGVAPVDYLLLYEYKMHCTGSGTLADVQAEYDTLLAVYSASQVQLLTCYLLGPAASTVSGMARLEEIAEADDSPTVLTLNLTFYVPGGMA